MAVSPAGDSEEVAVVDVAVVDVELLTGLLTGPVCVAPSVGLVLDPSVVPGLLLGVLGF